MPLVMLMRLLRIPEPFNNPQFLFEPKLDGFRALAHLRGHYYRTRATVEGNCQCRQ